MPLPADPTDEVLTMPPDAPPWWMTQHMDADREAFAAIRLDGQEREGRILGVLAEVRAEGTARGATMAERMDAAASRREGRLFALVVALVLAVLGLAGVQVSGAALGGEVAVGGVAGTP